MGFSLPHDSCVIPPNIERAAFATIILISLPLFILLSLSLSQVAHSTQRELSRIEIDKLVKRFTESKIHITLDYNLVLDSCASPTARGRHLVLNGVIKRTWKRDYWLTQLGIWVVSLLLSLLTVGKHRNIYLISRCGCPSIKYIPIKYLCNGASGHYVVLSILCAYTAYTGQIWGYNWVYYVLLQIYLVDKHCKRQLTKSCVYMPHWVRSPPTSQVTHNYYGAGMTLGLSATDFK